MAVTMNIAVFWDVTPCCSCKNVSEERVANIIRVAGGKRAWVASYCQLFSYLADFVTVMMEVILSSKTSVLTRATLRNILQEDIIYVIKRSIFRVS
jgi:hypothetical protein